jgi:biotin carboxyl carrier protein
MSSSLKILVNGSSHDVEVLAREQSRVRFRIAGREYLVEFESDLGAAPIPRSPSAGQALSPPVGSSSHALAVTAPIPGVIVALSVAAGQQVHTGDVLLTIEAMKMQNKIFASRDGIIERITVQPGDEVRDGQILLEFRPPQLHL